MNVPDWILVRVVLHVLESSWQAAVLAILVVLLGLLLRERLSARWRCALWLVVLVRLLMPAAPESPVSLFNYLSIGIPSNNRVVEEPMPAMVEMAAPTVEPQFSIQEDFPLPEIADSQAFVPDDLSESAVETTPSWFTAETVWRYVVLAWILGVLLVGLRFIILLVHLRMILCHCKPVEDADILHVYKSARSELGVHRNVRLLVSPRPVGPAVTGVFRPKMILSKSLMASLSLDELRLVFLHELSHIRRFDLIVQQLWVFAKMLHWFNPAVWLSARRWQNDRELACDESVLGRLDLLHQANYGRAILRVMESLSTLQPVPGAVGVVTRRSLVVRRINRIARYRPLSRGWTFLAATLLLLLIPIGLTNAVGESKEPQKTADEQEVIEEWGPENNGLRTRLVPAQKQYKVGQTARFKLEMKNFGDEPRTYDSQQVGVNGSMKITGPDGKPVRYVAGSFQSFGEEQSLAPGESVVLRDDLDMAYLYLFVKPGVYTLQFRGQNRIWKNQSPIPPSNVRKIEFLPEKLPRSVQVPARLLTVLPKQWDMRLNARVYEVQDGKITPPGWESAKGTYVGLVSDWNKQTPWVVKIWVAGEKLAKIDKTSDARPIKSGKQAVYLGKGADGYVYWNVPNEAKQKWPDIRREVGRALAIEGAGESDASAHSLTVGAQKETVITLAGRCVDEKGNPIADAEVTVHAIGQNRHKKQSQTKTDKTGHFRLKAIPAIRFDLNDPNATLGYSLAARKPGRAMAQTLIGAFGAVPAEVVFAMPKAESLTGRVTDQDGNPIEGAVVRPVNETVPDTKLFEVRTDAQGRFKVDELPSEPGGQKSGGKGSLYPGGVFGNYPSSGVHLFIVTRTGYAAGHVVVKRLPTDVTVKLQPGATIVGRVFDKVTGKPAAKVQVHVTPVVNQTDNPLRYAMGESSFLTDDEGRYRADSLAAGEYILTPDVNDRPVVSVSVNVKADQTQQAPDLVLTEGGVIEGRVVDAATGQPITTANYGVPVIVVGRNKDWIGHSTMVDENGRFRITVAPGKNYPIIPEGSLWNRTEGRKQFEEQGVTVGKGQTVKIEFRVTLENTRETNESRPPESGTKKSSADVPTASGPTAEEREDIAAIRRLGGWCTLDKAGHVLGVNMVYHETKDGYRTDNRNMSNEALQHIKHFPELRSLLLHGTQADDESLAEVVNVKKLQELMIWNARAVTDAGVARLAGHPSLWRIHISGNNLTDASLETFSTIPRLRYLSLQGHQFTNEGLKHLAGMTKLRQLIIGMGKTHIGDAGLVHLSRLNNLTSLWLQGCTLTDAGLESISGAKKMRALELKGAEFTGDGLRRLVRAFPKLKHLSFTCTKVTNEGLAELRHLAELECLTLHDCTDECQMPEAREQLQAALPKTKILYSFSKVADPPIPNP